MQGRLTKFAGFIKSRFVVTLGDAARAARAAFALIERSSDLRGQTAALRIQLGQQGIEFDSFIRKLQEVARGTVSTGNLIRASSTALLLGIPATEIAALLDIARVSAIATGTAVSAAFNDIAVGIGRSSPLILDNLGITVKLGVANENLARQLGKTTEELTNEEKKLALLTEVLKVGEERVLAFGDAQDTAALQIQRARAISGDLGDFLGGVFTRVLFGVQAVVVGLASVLQFLAGGLGDVLTGVTRLVERIPFASKLFGDLGDRLEAGADKSNEQGQALAKMALELAKAAAGFEDVEGAAQKAETAQAKATSASEAAAAAAARQAEEAARDAIAIDTAAEATEEFATSTDGAAESMDEFTEAAIRTQIAIGNIQPTLAITTRQFDELVRTQGRAVAIAAAGRSGLDISQSRITGFRGGGARFTTDPGIRSTLGTNLDGSPSRFAGTGTLFP